MIIQSELVKPGERAEILAPIPNGKRVTGVFLDPPTAASFTLEGTPIVVTAGEMLAYSGMNRPGIRIAVRHTGITPAAFRAEIDLGPELDLIQKSIEKAFEEAWSRGGDPS